MIKNGINRDEGAINRSRPRIAISRQALTSNMALLIGIACIKFLLHLVTSGNYGFFRDELYYIEAGKHLAFGYVDFPPLTALLAAFVRVALGGSLVAYHIVPALAGAFLVLLTGLIARELGGGRLAQCVAALASLTAPAFLGVDSLFSMDSLDELWWVLLAFILIRLIRRNQPQLWLLFGLVAGIGLMTKITMLMCGFAIVVGLLLTPQRKLLWNKWAWIGGAIAFAFLLPYILWNAANSWPTLEFWRTYSQVHGNDVSPLEFFGQQVTVMNPLTLPLWLAGLYYYFFTQAGKPYRVLGWTFVVLYILFTLMHAKLYFLSPAYPMLFAAGALSCERFMSRAPTDAHEGLPYYTRKVGFQIRVWSWLRPTYLSLLVLTGLVFAPIVMPLLPPSTYASVTAPLGGNAGIKVENRTTNTLPQQLADRFGWDTMTATVARVYHNLPQNEQAQACFFTVNYGEASAINFYGSQYSLPPAISGHNNYYLWGPGNCTGAVIITVGYKSSDLQTAFASISQVTTITCTYCMPEENNLPVYVCLHLKEPLQVIWTGAKHYD